MRRKELFFYFGFIFLVGFLGFVFVGAVIWNEQSYLNINYTAVEEQDYYHDLRQNVTGAPSEGVVFEILPSGENPIRWINSSGTYEFTSTDSYNQLIRDWINITNSSTGNLTIITDYDNQTGHFTIPILLKNESDEDDIDLKNFKFIINATNDAPNITHINSTYNFSAASPRSEFLNATDEEAHYPLIFNVTFNSTSCTHASWSEYNDNENCSLYDFGFALTDLDNVSALINFTPTNNHVGVYYANISVRDAGADYNSSGYPYQNEDYSQNKTFYYSTIVPFNVEGSLEINVSDCNNTILNESVEKVCNVTIRTKEAADSLNISTYAILRNYTSGQSGVVNTSWFHANESGASANFEYIVEINVTPTKAAIGNWTINFTVDDDNGDSVTEQIYIFVEKNNSLDDAPELDSISDVSTSVDLSTRINLTVYDNDLLIPDKNYYNETITFYVNITNQTTGEAETLNSFDVEIDSMPVLSGSALTNQTTAHISFTPNSSEIGDYTINITVGDELGQNNSQVFNLTVVDDTFPQWNQTSYTFVIWEDNETYLNLSDYVSYSGSLTFVYSFIDGNSFSSFNLTSGGIVNFTSLDADVGGHLVNITATGSYLSNTTTFNFTVLNLNDSLKIYSVDGQNTTPTTITNNSNVNATEDSYTTFGVFVEDNDLRIPTSQKSFYNENLTFNITTLNSTGSEVSLFNFTFDSSWWPQPDSNPTYPNRTRFTANFTPAKADVGTYNVTINVTDSNSYSRDVFIFRLTILEIDHNPVMSSLTNFSKKINDTWYYDVNATDIEDGNDTSGTTNDNFTFSYDFLSGTDFINNNETIFNTTTGIFNITFNDTQVGSYHLNLSVNDSGGKEDYEDFWIYVYGLPNITFPDADYVFNLTEDIASVLNFTVNHTVGNNLTYEFYIDSITYDGSNFDYGNSSLRYNVTSYGDGTNVSWSFTPNLTDETYGLLKNLTLVAYPNSSDLSDASSYNSTRVFKLNITHTNSDVSFDDNIDDQSSTVGTSVTINLWDHFSDADYSDLFHRGAETSGASVTFTLTGNTSTVTPSVSSGVLILDSNSVVSGEFYVNASDSFSSVVSNNFTVSFTEAPSGTAEQTSSGSSSTKEVPVSLKILMPEPVSAFQKDRIELPITLFNDGSVALYRVRLSGSVAKNGTLSDDVNITFSEDYFEVLAVGAKDNVTMIMDINTEDVGTFEITVNATVGNPSYFDWGKMYLTIKEGENFGEKIVFTEEFIADNPECLELKEMVDEAKVLFNQGKISEALEKSDAALQACKDAIAQAGKSKLKEITENKTYRYLIITTLAVFLGGIIFYSYKRMKLRKSQGNYLQENIKNRKYLEYK